MITYQDTLEKLAANPDPIIRQHAADLKVWYERRTSLLNLVQEALSQLRLDMKYLVFDLEATRRERDDAYAKLSNNHFE
jgi:hypothetical protein